MVKKSRNERFTSKMRKKLALILGIYMVCFVILLARLIIINRDNSEEYKKQVLSQQEYDSVVLPAKRGEIVDCNGTKIAVSQKVYNIVIDSKTLNSKEGQFLEPTLTLLYSTDAEFTYTKEELREYIAANPTSQYRVIAKKQVYDAVNPIMEALNNTKENPNIKGVWLEDTYQRTYPYGSLACDLIGFVQGDNKGAYGLEEYYDGILNGVDGREYGYLNDDENLERTIKSAENGRTLVTSIDVNIQSIVEKHILAFNKEHENEYREGNGSRNTGVVIMNPNTGEILAMASYPVYDLNNPWDTTGLDVTVEEGSYIEGNEEESEDITDIEVSGEQQGNESSSEVDINVDSEISAESVSENVTTDGKKNHKKTYAEAYEDAKLEALNALWKNFCITTTYEPGSTYKPFTMAVGLEEGILTGNESYNCTGVKEVGDYQIHCSNRLGHGMLTFSGALEQSCNVAFMDIGATIGKAIFMKYNKVFNMGLKTNVDLTGEALTNSLVFDVDSMTPTDLAISSFGQGFNVTMIQMVSGFCSLINGGYYYQPHVVTKIVNDQGATVETIEPRVLKQTISAETSEKIVELCNNVVSEGTGHSARPAGYRIGGKTGTAEKYPRKTGNYVVSFMGFAPADNPQIVIYTVIDEPNVESQASARYATVLTRDILTEVLPYMHIFMTEELTEEELAEMEEKQLSFAVASDESIVSDNEISEGENPVNGEETVGGEGDATSALTGENAPEGDDSDSVIVFENEKEEEALTPTIQIDEETGYAVDPNTGDLLDPDTGRPVDANVSDLE